MSEMNDLKATKPRRRFTLSLRGMMVLVLIVGGVVGWKARRASIQRRAVAEIKGTGGGIWYDFMWQNPNKIVPGASPWAPRWLREAVGDEYFQEPRTIFIEPNKVPGGRQPTDATYEAVAMLDDVEDLNSYRVPMSDAGFAQLATMPRLKSFCLLDVAMTDAGLDPVASFPALETLRLRVTPPGAFTPDALQRVARQPRLKFLELLNINLPDPASLAPLARLTRLEYIRLWRSPRDDSCLEHLRGLTGLKTLDLRQTILTDAGVDRLAGMDQLEKVLIDGSKLTDAGLTRLAAHLALTELYLNPSPNITDASLEALGKVRSITYLQLTGSNVSDAGLKHLQGLKLDGLNVSGPGVTDAGLAGLAASNQFGDLGLTGTSVTGAGLASLSGQTRLRTLSLDRSKVDDSGMAALASIPSLQLVTLGGTPLTDAGLMALVKGSRALTYLNVGGTKITAAGLAAARSIKPGLTIEAGPLMALRKLIDRISWFLPKR